MRSVASLLICLTLDAHFWIFRHVNNASRALFDTHLRFTEWIEPALKCNLNLANNRQKVIITILRRVDCDEKGNKNGKKNINYECVLLVSAFIYS